MGSTEVFWDRSLHEGSRHAAALQVALDVAGRVLALGDTDPEGLAGSDPMADLTALTELSRWLSGVQDEVLYAVRMADERGERDPRLWQRLACALGVTRTPARQRYELVAEGKRRGGGLVANLLICDAELRDATPEARGRSTLAG